MKRVLPGLSLFILVGCGETEISISEICTTKPGICNDLMDDSHCKLVFEIGAKQRRVFAGVPATRL